MERGVGHIEAILSFVLFIGFLIAALFFFNPLDTDRVVDSSLFYTFDEIKDSSSVMVESYSVVLKDNSVPDEIGIPFQDVISNNVRVGDVDGNSFEARFDSSQEVVFLNRNGRDFLNIRFSDDYEESGTGIAGQQLTPEQYSISSSDVEEILSEKRILMLNESYNEDYFGLKEDFNLPGRVNFGFSLKFAGGEEIISEIEIPESIEIFSDEERIKVLRTTGKIENADFVVKIW